MNAPRKMRWDCDRTGCFNHRCRPRFAVLEPFLSGNMGCMDIDLLTEVNGRFLVAEFKRAPGDMQTGQKLLLERLPAAYFTALVICSPDIPNMQISHVAIVRRGKLGDWKPCSLPALQAYFRRWSDWALANPAPGFRPRQRVPTAADYPLHFGHLFEERAQ